MLYFIVDACCRAYADALPPPGSGPPQLQAAGPPASAPAVLDDPPRPAREAASQSAYVTPQPLPAPAASGEDVSDTLARALGAKPCRACSTAQDMFAAFHSSQLSRQPAMSGGMPQATAAPPAPPEALQSPQAGHELSSSPPAAPKQPFWFYEDEMPCPPDILELGRATWTLLHSVAAYYPEQPSEAQQQQMREFISGLGAFYPCEECRGHLVKELAKHPPDVASPAALSHWACRLHNLVNVRLGKPEFDCSKVLERWRDGPADDADACGPAH